MARYIDAVTAAEIISEKLNIALDDLVDIFAEIPTADVVEVKHGHWDDRENPRWRAYNIRHCSMCGWNIPKNNLRKKDMNWNYCPKCGAKMDGGKHD